MASRKDGKVLEQLVAIIENAVTGNSNVKVQHDGRLTDKTTGVPRQFDVVLVIEHQHHSVVIAIECRDRARPVGAPDVEAFHTKCQHTGVNQGVIVSTNGFANTARTKADLLGIRCLDLEEVSSFNWMLAEGMRVIEKKLLHQSWKFFPEVEGLVDKDNMELLDEKGDAINLAVLTSNARRFLEEQLPLQSPPTDQNELVVRANGNGLILRNSTTGATTAVKFAIARLTYSIEHRLAPHRLVQYVERADDKHITDAAISEFVWGDTAMRMVIVYKEGEGGQVYLAVAPSVKK